MDNTYLPLVVVSLLVPRSLVSVVNVLESFVPRLNALRILHLRVNRVLMIEVNIYRS